MLTNFQTTQRTNYNSDLKSSKGQFLDEVANTNYYDSPTKALTKNKV